MIPEIILGHGIFVRIFPDGTALWYGHAGDRPYHVLRAYVFTMVRARRGGNGPVSGKRRRWIWELRSGRYLGM